jgi:hypothetical protein
MVLEQLAQQVPAVMLQAALQRAVVELGRRRAIEEVHKLGEALVAAGEAVGVSWLHRFLLGPVAATLTVHLQHLP